MALLDALFPVVCGGCGALGAPLCAPCDVLLEELRLPGPFSGEVGAAFRYEGVARSLVLGLKVRCLRPYARPLAAGITAVLRSSPLRPDAVSWVPARPSSIRQRGFDHAALLAAEVARDSGLRPARTLRALERPDQVGLGRALREVNTRGGFRAEGSGPLRGGVLLLVDDLVTTGATAAACRDELCRAGWDRVVLLAACKA